MDNFTIKRVTNIFMFIFMLLSVSTFGQYTAMVTEGKSNADLDVNISYNIHMADLSIEIGENIQMEDFTIGFTYSKDKADVVISNNNSIDFKVNIKSNYADLDIRISDNTPFKDVGIEIKKSGYVDYLIYSEIPDLTFEKLICAMLPVINLYLDEDDKVEKIPIYEAQSKKYNANTKLVVPPIIESLIEGEFTGWEGETIFKLTNGQIWQQNSFSYLYHYAYRPEVIIYETSTGYKMKVEDIEETVKVIRLK